MEAYTAWMEKAREDLSDAEYNNKGNKNTLASFLAHQATEKGLKAVYIRKHKDLIKTHDLVLLAEKIKAPATIIEACKKLNPLYLATRYPNIVPTNAFQKATVYITHA